jgi:hypothetical protein
MHRSADFPPRGLAAISWTGFERNEMPDKIKRKRKEEKRR